MEGIQFLVERLDSLTTFIIILFLWDLLWKLIALWKAARNTHRAWFLCIALINTVGILPIIYILLHKKKDVSEIKKQ